LLPRPNEKSARICFGLWPPKLHPEESLKAPE
jgi:hypothetical protein